MTDAILPGSPPRGNIKGRTNHCSMSSRFPTGQQQDKLANMTEHILFSSPPSCRPDNQQVRAHSLSSLPSSSKYQPTWESTFTLLHLLFFTDSHSHILSSLLSTKRKPHPIYGPLVSGKSFFHHSSFLLNQRILGETNWIFFNSCFNFSILIPVLTTESQFMLWHSATLFLLNSTTVFPSCDLQHKGSFCFKP